MSDALKFFLIEFFGCVNVVSCVWFILTFVCTAITFILYYVFKVVSLDSDDDDLDTVDKNFEKRVIKNKKLMSGMIVTLFVSMAIMIITPNSSTAKKMLPINSTTTVTVKTSDNTVDTSVSVALEKENSKPVSEDKK